MDFMGNKQYNISVYFRLDDLNINIKCDEYVTFTKEDDANQVHQTLNYLLKIDKIEGFLERHYI